jgi:ABC-2 type transport system permease protein
MSKLRVLAARDFGTRARGGVYIVTTIIGVLVLVGLAFGPSIIDRISQALGSSATDLLVVDRTGATFPILAETIAEQGPDASVSVGLADPQALPSTNASDFSTRARELLDGTHYEGILVVDGPEGQAGSGTSFTVVLYDAKNLMANDAIQNVLNAVVRRANAQKLNVTTEEFSLLFATASVSFQELTTTAGEGASTKEIDEQSHIQKMILAYFLLFILYMTMIAYGNMIASGVAEEKSSRIMEIMISSVRPVELMAGKIMGIGSLGLLQFSIWIATGLGLTALARSGILSNTIFAGFQISDLPLSVLVWFGLFFVLGFVLYAAVFAAAGASVSRVEDVNQLSTTIMMLMVVAFLIAYTSFLNPNSTVAVVSSMIPWLAPMVMFARIVLGDPPAIQIAVSVVLQLLAIVVSTWAASRIYRVGVLMYGKRPSAREILRYVREP